MKIPDFVVGLQTLAVSGGEKEYCSFVNDIVRKIACGRGFAYTSPNWCGEIFECQDGHLRLIYKDSAYGNDHYMVLVDRTVWRELPTVLNPLTNREPGEWEMVYDFQDGREILCHHIPGTWISYLSECR